jgi:hypothetical protein
MAVAFVEKHGDEFWSDSRRWMREGDFTYPEHKSEKPCNKKNVFG